MGFPAIVVAATVMIGVSTAIGLSVHRVTVRRQVGRHVVAPLTSGRDTRPSVTARIASFRYPGPTGPRSCLVITNDGQAPVHEVTVSAPPRDDRLSAVPSLTLWDQGQQHVADSMVVGTILPHEFALIPALIGPSPDSQEVILTCRSGASSWHLELEVDRRSRPLPRHR
jgi:hypothetical protein